MKNLDYSLYRSGKHVGVHSIVFDDMDLGANDFILIDLVNPSREELRGLQNLLKFPVEVLEALYSNSDMGVSGVKNYDRHLVVTANTLSRSSASTNSERVRSAKRVFAIGPGYAISKPIGRYHGFDAPDVFKRTNFESAESAVCDVLSGDSYRFESAVAEIGSSIRQMEYELISGGKALAHDEIGSFFVLRRRLVALERAIVAFDGVCEELADLWPCESDGRKLRRVRRRLAGVRDAIGETKEVMALLQDASNALEQKHLAETQRQLAAYAAIAAFPAVLGGIYGMNFASMPFSNSSLGFFGMMAVMASGCLLLYKKFKCIKWL